MDKHKINFSTSSEVCESQARPGERDELPSIGSFQPLHSRHGKPRNNLFKIHHVVTASEALTEINDILEVTPKPNYKDWLARKKWTIFEASCLLSRWREIDSACL